jgi:hypothetical protein
MGPMGAIYVADWHDQRTAQPDPDATWDRSNGRIVRIAAVGTRPTTPGDLTTWSSGESGVRSQLLTFPLTTGQQLWSNDKLATRRNGRNVKSK